jgi:hypothetical protein
MGQATYVAGPVERVSANGSQVSVLGQPYAIDAETIFKANGRRISGLAGIRMLQAGCLVAVESKDSAVPRTASSIVITNTQYTPGSSPVYVGGVVTAVAVQYGTLQIGDLAVDVSATPPDVLMQIEAGAFIEVMGIQPSPQGLLLGQEVSVSSLSKGTSGPGATLDTQSIGGTGSGASLQSIGGTGSTVSTQSIGGTGKSVSLQSIGGTGSTVSTQSIGGTGYGASLQSIGGTGSTVSTQSIGGTGKSVALQSIGGTGATVSTLSIGGTGNGTSLQSIGGTGSTVSSQSIGGTGSDSL